MDGVERILLAGAGGGFDVYSALPLALSLMAGGKRVHLANLSFTELHLADPDVWVDRDVARITPATAGPDDYFPERTLAVWLETNGLPSTVYAFPLLGVQPLRAAYRALVDRLEIDAVVLVDGGTDILMRGDEAGLGTPAEDMTSLAAVAGLDGVHVRLVACVGFGIDAYHGVNHTQVLENIGDLDAAGAYLGAFSIPSRSPEAVAYRAAVAHAQAATPRRPSIVNGQIAAALEGRHGDVRFTSRTRDSNLFVNPLMAMYFTFDLAGLADQNRYLDRLEDTVGIRQVWSRIEEFRSLVDPRKPRAFPH
ncbi:DUF1152 domain-containing protein [Asanoa iriomotensis]|uniref:DUF1152 domain-containing protein n=1 Tax=Asanoa iriomotensis TaxID=234613 RepID=A0ABQ4CEA9_9ACTN|nr:DUF1152 domain-containing protein [Asanoa iriomotensis]GIF61111.1 hypothetical protein Air01nite_72060 [Asanoa iriomotensis]